MKHYIIGEILENGEIEKGYTEHGSIYKNSKAFYEKSDEVCYIPDLSDVEYTYNDFLTIAGGKEDVAEMLFDSAKWEHPETTLDEMLRHDEAHICKGCDEIYISYEVERCPYCNQRKVLDIIENEHLVKYLYEIDDVEYSVVMYPKALDKMNWSWESLVFPDNDETFAYVEDKNNANMTYLVTNGKVKVTDMATEEDLSNDEISRLAKESKIDDCYRYYIGNNNWFSIEYCNRCGEPLEEYVLEEDVFEATPKTLSELADILLDTHLYFFKG